MKIFEVGVDKTTLAFLERSGTAICSEEMETPEDLYDWFTDGMCDAAVIDLDAANWGIFAVRYLRSKGVLTPVIGLSRGDPDLTWAEQRASFLENGGDDYLKSPPNPRELGATLRALTRRGKNVVLDIREFKNGNAVVRIDLGTQRVSVNGMPVHLTGKEALVLFLLASSGGRTQSKEKILENLYSAIEDEPEMKIIDVFVCKIRKKLNEIHEDAGAVLQTVWGRGYQIISPDPAEQAPKVVGGAA